MRKNRRRELVNSFSSTMILLQNLKIKMKDHEKTLASLQINLASKSHQLAQQLAQQFAL